MGLQVGAGYFGTSSVQTSVANADIIQSFKPSSFTTAINFAAYKFTFANQAACTILINDSIVPIYLDANQGFDIGVEDAPIYSFKIVQGGIAYNCVGAYC